MKARIVCVLILGAAVGWALYERGRAAEARALLAEADETWVEFLIELDDDVRAKPDDPRFRAEVAIVLWTLGKCMEQHLPSHDRYTAFIAAMDGLVLTQENPDGRDPT